MLRLENVLKMSSKCLEDVLARHLEDGLKTSWKHVEDGLKTYDQDEYIGLDQDVFKIFSEDGWVRRIYSSWWRRLQDVLKTASEDEDKRRLQDVFIKKNVCWVCLEIQPVKRIMHCFQILSLIFPTWTGDWSGQRFAVVFLKWQHCKQVRHRKFWHCFDWQCG